MNLASITNRILFQQIAIQIAFNAHKDILENAANVKWEDIPKDRVEAIKDIVRKEMEASRLPSPSNSTLHYRVRKYYTIKRGTAKRNSDAELRRQGRKTAKLHVMNSVSQ